MPWAALGNPPWPSILVVYAHPNPSDDNYQRSIDTIVARGVLANHVVHIPNLSSIQFGINNLGGIGF